MKRLLLILAVAGLLLAMYYGKTSEKQSDNNAAKPIVEVGQKHPVKNESKLTRSIAEVVKSGNNGLPRMVDNQTRLDKIVAGPGAQLTYIYTLPNYASNDVSSSWIVIDVRPKVAKDVCANNELRKLLNSGATLMYVYMGKNGVYINQFQVTQSDCILH